MQFSGVLNFIGSLLPFLADAEAAFGPGRGPEKRAYVVNRLRVRTAGALQRLGIAQDLDPRVKADRESLIDFAVDEAKFFGGLAATEWQRLKAGISLGFVSDPDVLAAYRQMQASKPLTPEQSRAWADYKKALPPVVPAVAVRAEKKAAKAK